MDLYELGLKYLLNHAPRYSIQDKDIGIVTATDNNTFVGVKTLYLSVKDKINFVCYDLGISKENLEWCEKNNLQTIKFENKITTIDKWQTYLKPFVIQASPFDYTIWMDSDCIVVGDLSTSKLIKNKETFFTRHWISKKHITKNSELLYEVYPVTGESDLINAGVFAINKSKDSNILTEWLFLVNITLQNEQVRKYVVNWDEGSLLWAIQKTNNGHKVVDENCKYNFYSEFFGDSLCLKVDLNLFYDRPILQLEGAVVPSLFFKKVLQTNAIICHFSTCMANGKKYWKRWTNNQ